MSQTSFKKERDPSILILDFGSQYSELIARRIRETNVFSLVVSNCISIEEINDINPKGIILSGGPNSVYKQNAPKCDKKIFDEVLKVSKNIFNENSKNNLLICSTKESKKLTLNRFVFAGASARCANLSRNANPDLLPFDVALKRNDDNWFHDIALDAKKDVLKTLTVGHFFCLVFHREYVIKKGINITLVDARFAKPLDENLIWQLATNHEVIITIEEGSIGGFGAHVSNFLNDKNLLDSNLKFRSMILPDKFIDQDKPENMYKSAGLDALSIENKVLEVLNSKVIVKKIN